eukprot:764775-Hanusia_phi.AAC.2
MEIESEVEKLRGRRWRQRYIGGQLDRSRTTVLRWVSMGMRYESEPCFLALVWSSFFNAAVGMVMQKFPGGNNI